jgi:cathepsin D
VLPAASVNRHIVPLQRQRVPVQNDDEMISFKSVYFGKIYLGAPTKQEFSVLFDTGSGHVIVPSANCESDACNRHNKYDHRLSATAKEVEYDGTPIVPGVVRDQVTVAFGTGEVTGQFANERLCLGTVALQPELSADASKAATADAGCVDMRVVTATEMSHEPFASFSFDGVFGLGLDSLALAPEFSFFGMFKHSGLSHHSFGVFLADNDEDFSEISFGGPNPARLASPLTYSAVASPELGHWQVKVLALRIGNTTLDFCKDGTCRAVVDSGTSSIAVPSSLVGHMKTRLDGSLRAPFPTADGGVDCREAVGQPLEFDVEGGTISLGPGDYTRAAMKADDWDETRVSEVALRERLGNCHTTLMGFDVPEPLGPKLFILGEPVLRKYYTEYDLQNKRIGFGLARQQEIKEKAHVGEMPGAIMQPFLMV